ncbi:MAG: LruC domain-containing protein [Prevotella sp.]|nr:LruC domain-containing protein [Prevotella sp.]
MKTTNVAVFMASVAMLTTTVGCRKMEVDSELIKEITLGEFPIDTIDSRHDWNLVHQMMVGVKADVPGENYISKVQILTGNPYQGDTEVMAEKFAQSGDRVTLSFEMPITESNFWVAAVSRSGKYYVMPSNNRDEFSFVGSDVISNGLLRTPVPQIFTYLFEENFPLPGDFDFNDVVLRISKENPSANILKLKVRLDAVGADKKIAAAIRLQGIRYEDVESVTIDEGKRFDEDYPTNRYFIDKEAIFTRGNDGSAVINLFDDAHWSLNPLSKDGRIVRLHYNTTKYEKEDESATVDAQTRTYTIVAKDDKDVLSYVTLSNIDPFIMENYNSINMEVHTYKYKYTQVLWQFHTGQTADDDHVTWALLIPSSSFRYPVEGIPIGRYRNGEIFGAYNRYNHSFGQWGRNKDNSKDWWKYPTSVQVY